MLESSGRSDLSKDEELLLNMLEKWLSWVGALLAFVDEKSILTSMRTEELTGAFRKILDNSFAQWKEYSSVLDRIDDEKEWAWIKLNEIDNDLGSILNEFSSYFYKHMGYDIESKFKSMTKHDTRGTSYSGRTFRIITLSWDLRTQEVIDYLTSSIDIRKKELNWLELLSNRDIHGLFYNAVDGAVSQWRTSFESKLQALDKVMIFFKEQFCFDVSIATDNNMDVLQYPVWYALVGIFNRHLMELSIQRIEHDKSSVLWISQQFTDFFEKHCNIWTPWAYKDEILNLFRYHWYEAKHDIYDSSIWKQRLEDIDKYHFS